VKNDNESTDQSSVAATILHLNNSIKFSIDEFIEMHNGVHINKSKDGGSQQLSS
jgi:hypothetical protein